MKSELKNTPKSVPSRYWLSEIQYFAIIEVSVAGSIGVYSRKPLTENMEKAVRKLRMKIQ
jgi:hypothetical protein